MASELTQAERDELRRRHVPCGLCAKHPDECRQHCAICTSSGDYGWPCPTVRALDEIERLERAIAWLRLDRVLGCEHPDWQIVSDYLLGDVSGRDVFAVIDELSREIDAVMRRVVERARQAVQP